MFGQATRAPRRHALPLAAAALCVLAASLARADPGDAKVRPILPGSIATLKAAQRSAATKDNQTMTAVIDARRAMLAAANESRSARPPRGDVEDAVGQGDGDGDGAEADEQQPTATASAATGSGAEEDQGDEHRPQNHR